VLVAATTDAGPEGEWSERLVEGGSVVAPHLALVEAANILRRLELAGRLSTLEATSAHQDLLRMEMEIFPYEPFAERVWALRRNLTAYDACYVALAEALELPLATLDRHLGWSVRTDLPLSDAGLRSAQRPRPAASL
jgi:predicted nucleic acid-binding protein